MYRQRNTSKIPFLSSPPHPNHDSPHFSVLSRQALLVSVCRIQRIIRRGEGRCVSQSVSALLTGLHGRLLTLLRIVSAYTTVVTWNVPILLGPRTTCVGNYARWIHGIESPKSCHLLHAIAGLAPHDWVVHQSVCIWSLRQKKRKLVSIALMCLVEVAAIADGWQGKEWRDSVHWSGHRIRVIVTI